MDQDVTWYGGIGLGPGDIVLDGHPTSPLKWYSAPTFWRMSIVAKRSPISATAELLFPLVDQNEILVAVPVFRCFAVCLYTTAPHALESSKTPVRRLETVGLTLHN